MFRSIGTHISNLALSHQIFHRTQCLIQLDLEINIVQIVDVNAVCLEFL